MSAKANYHKIGVFIVLGSVTLIIALIALGGGKWFKKVVYWESYFDESALRHWPRIFGFYKQAFPTKAAPRRLFLAVMKASAITCSITGFWATSALTAATF